MKKKTSNEGKKNLSPKKNKPALKKAGEKARISPENAGNGKPWDTSQYARSLIKASLDPFVTISANGKITDVNTRNTPVVVLTSSREERDLEDSYAYGVNSYVTKPIKFDEFAKVVSELELYWLLINRPPEDK